MTIPRKVLISILILSFLAVIALAFFCFKNSPLAAFLPAALPYYVTSKSQAQNVASAESGLNLPAEVNLKIPFTSQAPHRNWDLPYKQFCEEASVLMAASYINNQPISNPDDANAKLLAIKYFEDKEFGYYEDTNVLETAIILRQHYKMEKVEVMENPTIIDIKKALASGRAIIAPVAGRDIGNPHYLQPGPIYHMLVIKGYKKNGDFITNDPGTKRGADYIYKAEVLMEAIHNWDSDNIEDGGKAIIIVG